MVDPIGIMIDFTHRHILAMLALFPALLFLGIIANIKSEGKRITWRNFAETARRGWKAMDIKKQASHAWKAFFNPFMTLRELKGLMKK